MWGGIPERVGGFVLALGKVLSVVKQDPGVSEGPGRAAGRAGAAVPAL